MLTDHRRHGANINQQQAARNMNKKKKEKTGTRSGAYHIPSSRGKGGTQFGRMNHPFIYTYKTHKRHTGVYII